MQAEACADPEEKTVESVAAKRITKRHEADPSGRKEDEEEDEPSRSNVNNRRTHARRERRKRKHVDNVEPDDRNGGKFLAKISRMLRRRLEHASGSSKSQRSIAIELEEGRGGTEEENTREDSDDDSHLEGAAKVASSPKFRRPIDLARASSEETEEKTSDRRFEKATIDSSRFRRSVGKSKDARGESQGHKGERRAKNFRKSGRRRQRRDLGAIRRLIEPGARRDSIFHRKSSRSVDRKSVV